MEFGHLEGVPDRGLITTTIVANYLRPSWDDVPSIGSMYGRFTCSMVYLLTYVIHGSYGVWGIHKTWTDRTQLEVDRTKIEETRGPVDQLTRRPKKITWRFVGKSRFVKRRYVFKWFEFSIVIH